jgi:hypothetical protein
VITRRLFLMVVCDACADRGDGRDGGIPLFDTIEQARAYLDGWQVSDDGQATCDQCLARQVCTQQGHDWDDWQDCACGGLLTQHQAAGCDQHRWCLRCGQWQRRDPTTPTEATR